MKEPQATNGQLDPSTLSPEMALPSPKITFLRPAEEAPLRLTPQEKAAMEMFANNVSVVTAKHAPRRSALEAEIAQIDREIAHCNGMAQGALRTILKLRGIEGDWNLQSDGTLVKAE